MTEYDYFSGDPKRLWQDQIAGIIDFDHGSFIGALSDLQSDPDWKQAFATISTDTGMPEFIERVQAHFDLCHSPHNPDGSIYAYQHPTRTNKTNVAKNISAMMGLMQRYLATTADAVSEFNEAESKRMKEIKVAWTDNFASIDKDNYARDGRPAGISIYGAMSDIEDGCLKTGTPNVMNEIREAAYGLASSYDLQRCLMQEFYTHEYDVSALYELEWKGGCSFYFDEATCYVYDAAAKNQ